MKGIYVLKHEQRFIAGYESFSLSKGAKVQVTQVDKDKVLIDFGSRTMDWYDISFLQKHFSKENWIAWINKPSTLRKNVLNYKEKEAKVYRVYF